MSLQVEDLKDPLIFLQGHVMSKAKHSVKFDAENPLVLASDSQEANGGARTEVDELLAEDIELRAGRQSRNIILEGEDSSDEENLRKSNLGNGDDDDDDMFGGSDKEAEDQEVEEKDQVKLLDMAAFEKQEELNVGEKHEVSGLYDNDEVEVEVSENNANIDYFVDPDGENISKSAKLQEPKIEAFHLRDDLEEGDFDADGNFIRKADDSEAHHDSWLEDVSKEDIRKAREAQIKRATDAAEDANSINFIPKSQLLSNLISLLEIGETPLEALQSLNKCKPVRRSRKNKTTELSEEDASAERERRRKVEQITEYTDKLADAGITESFDLTREQLAREYHKEVGQPYVDLKRKRSSSPEPPEVQWEFKWEGADDIHGPYTSGEMASWAAHNYFDERVSVRRVGTDKFVGYNQVTY